MNLLLICGNKMLSNYNTPVTNIKGVGPKTAEHLSKLDINSVGDLLEHFPRSYLAYGGLKKISELLYD